MSGRDGDLPLRDPPGDGHGVPRAGGGTPRDSGPGASANVAGLNTPTVDRPSTSPSHGAAGAPRGAGAGVEGGTTAGGGAAAGTGAGREDTGRPDGNTPAGGNNFGASGSFLQPRGSMAEVSDEYTLPPSALDQVSVPAFDPSVPVARAYASTGQGVASWGVFLLLSFVLIGWQFTCLFSELCFHASDERPVVSSVQATVSFPVGVVLVLVLIPLGFVSVRLQRHRLVAVYMLLSFVTAALLLLGAIFALRDATGSSLTERAEEVWNGLTLKDRAFFNNEQGQLRKALKDDSVTLGVLAIVGAVLTLFAGCTALVMLRRQWQLCCGG